MQRKTNPGRKARPGSPNDRLRQAREAAGWASAMQFAHAAKINYTTYAQHENGRRDLKQDIATRYERLLNLKPSTLLYGEQLPNLHPIPIVAYVGTAGKIETIPSSKRPLRKVVLPDPTDLVGLEVRGMENFPVYYTGDLVFHRQLHPETFDVTQMHGLECVVELLDGTRLLRRVTVNANGRVTLLAYQGPPMMDQVIVAAARVELVQRAEPKRTNMSASAIDESPDPIEIISPSRQDSIAAIADRARHPPPRRPARRQHEAMQSE